MSYLVVNCGSDSVKMSVFQLKGNQLDRFSDAHIKQLFSTGPTMEIEGKHEKICLVLKPMTHYSQAIENVLINLKKMGFSETSLKIIGHRVVHGGVKYIHSTLITSQVEQDLRELTILAPLHNPPAMEGIDTCKRLFPQTAQIAVFDTAFHAALPHKAAFYPIPWELSQKYKIKRYGFHGIAHAFSWNKYLSIIGKSKENQKVITVHLGSGCSIAAINDGVSIDTSMGFTPLDGIMMSTRSGELDPAIVSFLSEKEGKSSEEIVDLLNHRSGLLGVSEKSKDMRDILKNTPFEAQSKLALEMFVYSVIKKIGSYIAALNGVNAIIFSGGMGENAPEIRRQIMQAFSWYSVLLDDSKNDLSINLEPGDIKCISQANSKAALYVVGTDENLFIAEQMLVTRLAP